MRKSPYLLNNFRNFNEIFKIGMTYDNINSDKKAEFHFLVSIRKGFQSEALLKVTTIFSSMEELS